MDEVKKIFYSIQEVQAMTGLPASTLRYWEQQFEGLNPRKDGHGNRYYSEQDIALIKQIQYIRDEMKITRIEAIRNRLKQDSHPIDQRQRATEILLRIRQTLMDIRSNL